MTAWDQGKILISGAGVVGLLLAQSLKKLNIPYEIFDRDESISARGQGWGITIHWALNDMLSMLPEDLIKSVYDAQVYENFHENDNGNFIYINGSNGIPVVNIPPAPRLRVRREELRVILSTGIDVNWGCQTINIETDDDATDINKRVTVTCKNGKVFQGGILMGIEGSKSVTRSITNPTNHELQYLPIRFIGGTIELSEDEYRKMATTFSPLLFQGTIPQTESFFWYSLLATPKYTKNGTYKSQIMMSWKNNPDEPFDTPEEKYALIKIHSKGLDPRLQYMIDYLDKSTGSFMELQLADWPICDWNDFNNKILLMGDACHAMTMYRGEACNHGIADVKLFTNLCESLLNGKIDWNAVVGKYKTSIKDRCSEAVLLSRQACIDAHDWSKIFVGSQSPLLAIRKKNL